MTGDVGLPRGSISGVSLASRSHLENADEETASEGYARRFAGEVGEFFLGVQSRVVLDLLSPWPAVRVLDVGGGHAQIAVPLAHSGYGVTVAGSHESCRRRLDRFLEPGRVKFDVCDLLSLPYHDDAFDVVVAFRLLAHVKRWRRLVAEMCRVARRAVVIDYPDLRSFNLVSQTFFRWKKAVEKNTRPFTCFTRRQLSREFARYGFEEPTFRPEFFVPMVVHRAIGHASISRALEAIGAGLGLRNLFGSPMVMRVVVAQASVPSHRHVR
ncbi:MAG: class I SAM-dependent methyltransferase [Acidobacteriota bacterium]